MRISLLACLLFLSPAALVFAAEPSPGDAADAATQLARGLGMTEIPHEGPLFVQVYQGEPLTGGEIAARYAGPRPVYTSIYGIITSERFSALHRLATDELWHFYGGSPIEMLLLYPDGHGETVIIGPDVLHGQHALFRVPAGVWQGSRLLDDRPGAYALGGNTLAPGFDYADYEPGYRDELIARYPRWADRIRQLTRSDSLHRPAGAAISRPAAEPVTLVQKMGRAGPVFSDDLSIARFQLAPGAVSASSYLRHGTEVLQVVAGTGELEIDGTVTAVAAGGVYPLPAGKPHRLRSRPGLEGFAICRPAFDPKDYVEVEPARFDHPAPSGATTE